MSSPPFTNSTIAPSEKEPITKTPSPKRPRPEDDSKFSPPSKRACSEIEYVAETRSAGPIILETINMGAPTAHVNTSISQYDLRDRSQSYQSRLNETRSLAKDLSSSMEKMPVSAQKGLPNLTGVLCYRSSLCQSLLHSAKFVNYLKDHHVPENCTFQPSEDCVGCSFRRLAMAYWENQGNLGERYKSLHQLLKHCGWNAGPSGQGDPEEQYVFITKLFKSQFPTMDTKRFEAFQHISTDIGICCRKCGHVSLTTGHVTSHIPVDIPFQKTRGASPLLTTQLDKYFHETVQDYKCEKCGRKDDKSRNHQIAHLPDQLLLQMKRYDNFGRRISTNVSFTESLSLDKYRTRGNGHSGNYSLFAVVCHSGGTNYGHYISYTKDASGAWWCFNDEKKTKSAFSSIIAQKSGFKPYLLFYQRI